MSDLHPISGCENADRKADVVFVHGLGGDAFATWRYGEDGTTSWPHWLGEEFPAAGIWSLGYAASPTKLPWLRNLFSKSKRDRGQAMSIERRAGQVLDLMVLRGLGQRPIFFICHSLGGLLVKEILRRSCDDTRGPWKPVFNNTRSVLFLATPHAGADMASLLTAFSVIFDTTVNIEDLRAHDAHLEALYNWYREHAPVAGIQTAGYYEHRAIWGHTIVNVASAQPGIGSDILPLDEDHISIAKPRNRDSQVFLSACGLLRDIVLTPRQAGIATQNLVRTSVTTTSGNLAVPFELPPGAEHFFGRQYELKTLRSRLLAGKNTAVIGFAGMGKTALAARALVEVVGNTPASLASSPYPDGTIYLDLYSLKAAADAVWENLVDKVAGSDFQEHLSPRERAVNACDGKRLLVIIEGGEEADGLNGRMSHNQLLDVLGSPTRYLFLTRSNNQIAASESVFLREALQPDDAAQLFDSLTEGRIIPAVRAEALKLLEGHPLALTWACNLLIRGDDTPGSLVADWRSENLPSLTDPRRAEHTLEWLFARSIRDLDQSATSALEAAALLGRAPFPLSAIEAALGTSNESEARIARDSLRTLAQRALLRPDGESGWQFTHVLGYRFARKEFDSDPDIRMRLGAWLEQEFQTTLQTPNVDVTTIRVLQNLEHLTALLRADNDQALWQPLAMNTLYHHQARLTSLGRLAQAGIALEAVKAWLDQLPVEKSSSPAWIRERASLLNFQGNIQSAQGDLAVALSSYQQSLEICRSLAASDRSNTQWQRDLSVYLNKVGDIQSAQGDLASALFSYQQSLEICRTLAASDRSNTQWQRDLSIGLDKVGNIQSAQGDLPSALFSYQQSLEICRTLAASDRSNTEWQRDLSVSLDNMGDIQSGQGDLASALSSYQQSLEICRSLAASDRSNTQWQRDLSVYLNKVGDIQSAQGDLASALFSYQQSFEICRTLAASDRSNTQWQRDLSIGLDKVGNIQSAQGDLPSALFSYQQSLEIRRTLAASDRSNTQWQRDLSWSLKNLAELNEGQADRPTALKYARESLAIDERLAALDHTNATWQKDVRRSRALFDRLQK